MKMDVFVYKNYGSNHFWPIRCCFNIFHEAIIVLHQFSQKIPIEIETDT
jgi:hypothetical protein